MRYFLRRSKDVFHRKKPSEWKRLLLGLCTIWSLATALLNPTWRWHQTRPKVIKVIKCLYINMGIDLGRKECHTDYRNGKYPICLLRLLTIFFFYEAINNNWFSVTKRSSQKLWKRFIFERLTEWIIEKLYTFLTRNSRTH